MGGWQAQLVLEPELVPVKVFLPRHAWRSRAWRSGIRCRGWRRLLSLLALPTLLQQPLDQSVALLLALDGAIGRCVELFSSLAVRGQRGQ